MTRDETFKCRKLKGVITAGRCMLNQKEAIAFWGPDASKFSSCPCDQGIEIRQQVEGIMGSRGICKNCEREMAIMQEGMCGSCCLRSKGLEGKEREDALAKAKEDFKGKGPMHGGRYPRGSKVEGRAKTDPGSGAIASSCSPDIGVKVEGTQKKHRRRPCSNCGRNLFIVAKDLCFTCYSAAGKLQGDALEAALAEVRRRIEAGELHRGVSRKVKRTAPGPDVSTPASMRDEQEAKHLAPKILKPLIASSASSGSAEPFKQPGSAHTDYSQAALDAHLKAISTPVLMVVDPPVILSIVINFTDGDHNLFVGLQALARKYRRSPDQQLLWLLEHELTSERLLPGAKATELRQNAIENEQYVP